MADGLILCLGEAICGTIAILLQGEARAHIESRASGFNMTEPGVNIANGAHNVSDRDVVDTQPQQGERMMAPANRDSGSRKSWKKKVGLKSWRVGKENELSI
ncbi:hypothetical protein BC835DRAFT_1410824 [Cytidiella melzeri]|nr:hypothetical protein BC835DRAFT_1410824 [Cytidiella melzeri]